jgi:hypothetical protein
VRRGAVAIAGLVALTAGCDYVGAPLIDRSPPPADEGAALPCNLPPSCEAPSHGSPSLPRVEAMSVDLRACGSDVGPGCPLAALEGALGRDVDAGVWPDGASPPCNPGEDASSPNALVGAAIECAELALSLGGGEFVIAGATLRHVNLRITASQQSRVTLTGATIEAVFLELHGPVALRVENPRSVAVLQMTGASAEAGRPRVELVDMAAIDVAAGTTTTPFDGEVALDRVELDGASLHVDRVDLQSVACTSSRIEARALTATDLQLSDATLVLGDAVLSAFSLFDTAIERCESAGV